MTISNSLMTGSRTNRSKLCKSNFKLQETNVLLDISCHNTGDAMPKNIWFAKGCYRKDVLRKYKKNFRATKSLTDDLEYLFLKGFQMDGPKKGKNKYTAQQAVAFLNNMILEDGRRKYSNRDGNPNGPLPNKQYVQAFFHKRKMKMQQEEASKARRLDELIRNNNEDIDNSVEESLEEE